MERGEDEYLITPYYSDSDMGTARLMALVSQLPSTRQEARERVREEEEKQREARDAEGAEGHEYWLMFQASFLCTECGREIQVTGPFTEFSCEKCGNVSKLDPAVWKDLLSGVSKAVTHDMQEGEGGSHRTEGPPEGHLIFGRMKPYCRKCKADLQVCDGAVEARSVRCPECGCAVRTVPPPDWFLELVPGTFMILSPDAENDESLPRSVDEQRWFAGIRIESGGD